MNQKRRKKIKEAIELLEYLIDIMEECRDEEEEVMTNTPESFQESDRYAESEECVETLENAIDDIESVAANLQEIIE